MPKLKRINLSDDLFTDLKDSNKLSGYTIDEFQLQSDSNYSEYYVQNTEPTKTHGTLWYDTTNNKLFKYNEKLSKWVEIDWQQIIKATPEWKAGRLQITSGQLQVSRYGDTWTNVYPAIGSRIIRVMNETLQYYNSPQVELQKSIWVNISGNNTGVILKDGKLYTTSGNNSYYSNATTGRGLNGQNPFYGVDNFKRVPVPTHSSIVKVGGFYHSYAYALLANGDLYTWGGNTTGQCGDGTVTTIPTPKLVAQNVIDVYDNPTQGSYNADQGRLFILKSDGLYATGYNINGQLGVGDTTDRLSFTKSGTWTSASQIVKLYPIGCDGGFNFLLDSNGKIWFCGYNVNGVCGDGTTANKTSWVDVTNAWAGVTSGVQDIQVVGGGNNYDVSTAYYNTYAVMLITLPNGTKILKSCGYNDYGNLGDGTTTTRTTPVTVLSVPANNVIKLRANGCYVSSIHALCSNGDLYGWGSNSSRNVGDGTAVGGPTPIIVATGVKDIFLNGQSYNINNYLYQTFIMKSDGLYGCGVNDSGYLGLGHTTSPITSFTKVLLPLDNDEIVDTMGCYTTETYKYTLVAITSKRRMFAWGYNGGNGITSSSTINCLVPIQFTIQED